MSDVTNLILSISTIDEDAGKMKEVNRYFIDRGIKPLVSVDDPSLPTGWYGGSKYFECGLYLGSFNHLDLHDFLDYLRSLSWSRPQQIQIMVKEQEDERFTIIDL